MLTATIMQNENVCPVNKKSEKQTKVPSSVREIFSGIYNIKVNTKLRISYQWHRDKAVFLSTKTFQ